MSSINSGSRKEPGKVISIDEEEIRGHLDGLVRETVEETLNGLLDAEADRICQAGKYEFDVNYKSCCSA